MNNFPCVGDRVNVKVDVVGSYATLLDYQNATGFLFIPKRRDQLLVHVRRADPVRRFIDLEIIE